MNDISLAFPVPYATASKYLPMMSEMNGQICKCYGIRNAAEKQLPKEIRDKIVSTSIPDKVNGYFVRPLRSILHWPEYYSYLTKVKLLDATFAKQVAKDASKILFTSPLFPKTVSKAKESGKIVVVEAGNSEPEREYARVNRDYKQFDIHHKYVYGDPILKNTCGKSLQAADRIVAISEVSLATYLDAGYKENKMTLIPLTGTDMPVHHASSQVGKEKAFISTGFHSFIKGTHRLLLAWKEAAIKDIPLLIVGRLCEDMKEFVEAYGPFHNVQFIGHRNDLREWYLGFDAVGVLMSLSEGAVRVIPEMMSFGFPMIVSPDATCDLICDGQNGFVIDATDEARLVERLKWFAEDWTRVYALRENVIASLQYRTVRDYSLEVFDYLKSLSDI